MHSEYSSRITDYREYDSATSEGESMHGPAVASLFIGRTCGVAPGAELIYKAVPSGRNFNFQAYALFDIIEQNKSLPLKDKIRIVSCSIGYMEERPEPGLERWIKAIKTAESEGIIVSDVGDRTGVDYIGGGTCGDKNDVDSYDIALFMTEDKDEELKRLISERDIDGLLRKTRKIKGKQVEHISDINLKKMIEKSLDEKRNEIIIPSDYRTMASNTGPEDYMYNGKGGMSWSVPYISGLFALALQINPNLRKEVLAEAVNKTVILNKKGLRVINPRGFIEAIRREEK